MQYVVCNRARVALAMASMGIAAGVSSAAGLNNMLFLHHFDTSNPNPVFADKPGDASYANGSASIYTEDPPFSNAPGGMIVSTPAKFGAGSLLRTDLASVGGRVEFDVANNFDITRGTIDMWINSAQLSTNHGFLGLWGTRSALGPGDVRMYIYDVGGARALGGYMIGSDGTPSRWEIEQVIPVPLLTNNVWHHVAWEWDNALGATATYWDGQLLRNTASFGTVHFSGSLASQSVTRFHIGENQGGSAPFPGYMDEFRISDVRRYNGASFAPPTQPYSTVVVPTWAVNSSGNWTDAANWTAAVPNAVDATAVLGSIISVSRTVTVNAPITVGTLNFDNANAYVVAGTSTLTIQTSSGQGAISLANGNHTISAPLALASDTKLSGLGTLKISTLSIAGGKSLDTSDRSLVVDYSGSSPRASLEAMIASGYNSGGQNGAGIRTSSGTPSRRLGIAEAVDTTLGGSFNGQSLDATTVVIRYTIAGDADLSGSVTLADFTRLAANFGTAGKWSSGDFDYSGGITLADFTTLAANFGTSIPADVGRGVVPEPSTVGLIGTTLLIAGLTRRRASLRSI